LWLVSWGFNGEFPELIMMLAGWSSKKTGIGLANLCSTIKNTMDKSLQTMVGATDTVFFAAMTLVFDVGTMVFFTHTMVPVPETTVFATQTIFLIRKTIVPVAKTMASGFDTLVFVSLPIKTGTLPCYVMLNQGSVPDFPAFFIFLTFFPA
jgi:hypothetical protein